MTRKLLLLLPFEILSLVFTVINFHCIAQIARVIQYGWKRICSKNIKHRRRYHITRTTIFEVTLAYVILESQIITSLFQFGMDDHIGVSKKEAWDIGAAWGMGENEKEFLKEQLMGFLNWGDTSFPGYCLSLIPFVILF